ncbi:SDR family oxidoreductase [Streptomyces sp. NBC_00448]|uniref:SDR family oxidoreductase n=1 Tax=Streptomyces sp. NBC_00448 TaxID=2903652 RepID=UPI002E24AD18
MAVTGRNESKLKAFLDEAGHSDLLLGLVADAADRQATESVVTRTVERFGALDAAVANAGFMSGDSIGAGDPTQWSPMVLTNVLGPALLAHAALPHLEATRIHNSANTSEAS